MDASIQVKEARRVLRCRSIATPDERVTAKKILDAVYIFFEKTKLETERASP